MGALAYVEPALAMPVVCQHFEEALSTVTATHQLVASLDALAVCVRPMLLYDNTLNDTPVDVLVAQVYIPRRVLSAPLHPRSPQVTRRALSGRWF